MFGMLFSIKYLVTRMGSRVSVVVVAVVVVVVVVEVATSRLLVPSSPCHRSHHIQHR